MKKYFSIFEMGTGRSLYVILSGAAILEGIEMFLFNGMNLGAGFSNFGYAVMNSWLPIVFLVVSVFFTVLALKTWKLESKTEYSYKLLGISQGRAYQVSCIAGTLVYMFYWASQVLMIFVLYRIYLVQGAEPTDAELFTDIRLDPFLSALIPLENVFGWIVVVFRALMVGTIAASIEYRELRGAGICGMGLLAISLLNGNVIYVYGVYINLFIVFFAAAGFFLGAMALNKKKDNEIKELNEGADEA